MNTNIDSGDENVADGDASVLSGNQSLGCAALEMKLANAMVVRGNDDEQNKTNDNQDLAPELKKKKKKNQRSNISINGHILLCLLLMILNGIFLLLT